MPQMKPMNWLLLLLMLNMIIMMMNIKNYFLKNNSQMNTKTKKINKNFINWKW